MIPWISQLVLPLLGSLWILCVLFKAIKRLGITEMPLSRWRVPVTGLFIVVTLGTALLGNSLLNVVMLFLVPLIGHLFYNPQKRHLVYYFVLVTVLLIVGVLVSNSMGLLFLSGILVINNQQMLLIAMNISVRIIEYGALMSTTWFILKGQCHGQGQGQAHGAGRAQEISLKDLASFMVLPLFTIIFFYTLIYLFDLYFSESLIVLFLINLSALVGINVYFAKLFESVARRNQLEKENALFRQQAGIQERHYAQLEQQYLKTNGLVHDMRHHLQAMERLYQSECQPTHLSDSGQTTAIYAQQLHGLINQLSPNYYCQDKLVNMILNDKALQMKALDIETDFKLGETTFGFMRPVDITTVFANLLDNAMEATKVSNDTKDSNTTKAHIPTVQLRVSQQHHFISITVKNPCTEAPTITDAGIKSTKASPSGLGLKNVARVASAYQGDLQYEWRDGYFYSRVLLSTVDHAHIDTPNRDPNLRPI